jgi:hypothetical protein
MNEINSDSESDENKMTYEKSTSTDNYVEITFDFDFDLFKTFYIFKSKNHQILEYLKKYYENGVVNKNIIDQFVLYYTEDSNSPKNKDQCLLITRYLTKKEYDDIFTKLGDTDETNNNKTLFVEIIKKKIKKKVFEEIMKEPVVEEIKKRFDQEELNQKDLKQKQEPEERFLSLINEIRTRPNAEPILSSQPQADLFNYSRPDAQRENFFEETIDSRQEFDKTSELLFEERKEKPELYKQKTKKDTLQIEANESVTRPVKQLNENENKVTISIEEKGDSFIPITFTSDNKKIITFLKNYYNNHLDGTNETTLKTSITKGLSNPNSYDTFKIQDSFSHMFFGNGENRDNAFLYKTAIYNTKIKDDIFKEIMKNHTANMIEITQKNLKDMLVLTFKNTDPNLLSKLKKKLKKFIKDYMEIEKEEIILEENSNELKLIHHYTLHYDFFANLLLLFNTKNNPFILCYNGQYTKESNIIKIYYGNDKSIPKQNLCTNMYYSPVFLELKEELPACDKGSPYSCLIGGGIKQDYNLLYKKYKTKYIKLKNMIE